MILILIYVILVEWGSGRDTGKKLNLYYFKGNIVDVIRKKDENNKFSSFFIYFVQTPIGL